MADPAQSSTDGAAQYSLDHSKLIDDSALDVLLQEWGQTLRQPAALPADDLLAHYGVFGAPETGHLLLYFTRRLGQPPSVFFRALQLFERFMETHMAEMHQYIVTKVERDSRQKEWKNLLERIRSQAILRMLSCIQISSKLALHYKILTTKRVKSLLREVKHCYSLESVVNSEVRILKTLKYKVSGPTALEALETLLAMSARQQPALLEPLCPALPSAAVRLLRTCCARRDQLLLTVYRRATGRAQLGVGPARRQFAAVLADAPLLAAGALAAAAFLVRRASSEPVLVLLAELTLIPAEDLRQLTEVVLVDLLPASALRQR
ncbi:cyclin N-terminal domain-containing protein 1-like [Amphibalanus amphitrite]|uniref:cyclin N-terminal domain-containing protein 1-like n=1 Tax=Amphibalanus amphitrite TaxID=1232801 RepID=UPI001C9160AF|nr:cyclin N-terminal domain-containing protein 1-like [Amphibalanus amphitrite]XP_043210683.1 cyclin N-terminal domain-containing protein 1-like [Amphibalanus amphitrite]XP_043210684.1 cyclin N-terminal domain-containing protein 1-like [Amphibalanus amphitrite]